MNEGLVCPNCGSGGGRHWFQIEKENSTSNKSWGHDELMKVLHDFNGNAIGIYCGNCGYTIKNTNELLNSDEFVNHKRTKTIDKMLNK